MDNTAPNLLDLLDTLRELPSDEQNRRLAELPAAVRDQLRQWLKASDNSADPFAGSTSDFPGANPRLLSDAAHLASDSAGKNLKSDEHGNTTLSVATDVSARIDSANSTRRTTHRTDANGRLAFQAGDVLMKQYRIVCQLGRGGMGEVFRAIDDHAGEQVALKFLPVDRMANPQALALLKSEVRLAHLVRSPYVCAVHALHIDSDPPPGQLGLPPFIAMQFIEGEDLQTLLKRVERLSGPKVVRIANELAKGLSAIHAAGILHRDLKPSNVMLDVNGIVQILDFGIASSTDPAAGPAMIAGTPAYMAPEAKTGPATPASDIYALGLLLFELLTGHMASHLIRDGLEPANVLEQFKEQIPRELAAPIARCLHNDPAGRFQSMDELLAALPTPPPQRKLVTESISTIAKSDAVAPFPAWALKAIVAFIVIAAIAVYLTPGSAGLTAARQLNRDPAELAMTARHSVARLFNSTNDPHQAWGFAAVPAAFAPGARPSPLLPHALYFWYRSAPNALEPASAARGVSASDPFPAPGITTITLDLDGTLIEAYRQPDFAPDSAAATSDRKNSAHPARDFATQPAAPAAVAGDVHFPAELAEELQHSHAINSVCFPLVPIQQTALPATWLAPVPLPAATQYWIESSRGMSGPPMSSPQTLTAGASANEPTAGRLIIATLATKILYIGHLPPDASPTPAPAPPQSETAPALFAPLDHIFQPAMLWLRQNTTQDVAFWWMYALPVLGLTLAIRNVRLRRCDTRNASRLSAIVFVLSFLGWVLMTHPAVGGKSISERWNTGIGNALFIAAEAWIGYAAVDPYARLTWKRSLIGYARLTARWPSAIVRDAVVGRSLLAGAAIGLAMALLLKVLEHWTIASAAVSTREQMAAALAGNGVRTAGLLCRSASSAIVFSLLQLVTLVLLHWLTRRRLIATILFCLITPLLWALFRNDFAFPAYLIYPAIGILTAIALIHEGVLAMAIGLFFSTVLTTVPITFNPAAINFGISLTVMLLLVLLVLAGLSASLPRIAATRWLPSDPIRGDTGGI